MKFVQPTAEVFIPDGLPLSQALARTTHLAIGAHQDDLEFMALHGILECYQSTAQWFTGVTVTDGRGSSRANEYAAYSDDQMQQVRRQEQKKAAYLGEYAAAFLLDHPSSVVKQPGSPALVAELKQIITACGPGIIYTHNLADKHDTHIGVAIAVIQALRELPESARPRALYGCEVWRNLDWLGDDEKIVFDVSARENISLALMGVFDSQISGGKRYDLATAGRKRANATYFASHSTDRARMLEYAMDLTPLIQDPARDIQGFVQGCIERFAQDVKARLARKLGA